MRSFLIAIALVALACAPSQRPAIPAPECMHNSDCTGSQICSSGRCVVQCLGDRDCAAGQTCTANACVAASGCLSAKDCPTGDVCSMGLCVLPAPECVAAADCGAGKACSPTGRCVAACAVTADCGPNLTCSNGACVSSGTDAASISGTAVYAGQPTSAGIQVTLRGTGANAKAVTAANGSYGFAGLIPGLYTLTFVAPSTAEGSIVLQVSAAAGATSAAPPVTFTPLGEVRGTVHLTGQTSALNVQVFVAGTARGASTDSSGVYDIAGVPLGAQKVIASFPGYSAATATVTVGFGAVTQVPDITLQPQVVINNSIFAFASQPPTQVVVGRPYLYTAVAGGAGIVAVSYSIAAGPAGMTIDSLAGAVSFTPDPTRLQPGNYLVAIAASGGGAVIYQVYNLLVLPPLQSVLPLQLRVSDADTAGGITWAVQDGALQRLAPALTTFDATTAQRSAASTSLAMTNGGGITGFSYPGGKVTSLSTSAGALAATWAGGKVGSYSVSNSFPVASVSLEGGTVAASGVSVAGLDTVVSGAGAFSFPSRTPSSITAAKIFPTKVDSNDTGLATAVTATTLSDSTQTSWGAGQVGRCLFSSTSNANFQITAAQPGQLTVGTSFDLTTAFSAGRRYFVTNCYGSLIYTVQAAQDFSTLANRYADFYVDGALFKTFWITTGANGSFTFYDSPQDYGSLVALPGPAGFILVAEASNSYHLVTLTDSVGGLGSLAGQSVGVPGVSGPYLIDSSTATQIVFRAPLGVDISRATSFAAYVLVGAQGAPATVQLTTGGLTPSALKSKFLWNDALGQGYPILDNAVSTVTIGVPPEQLTGGPASWSGAQVAPTAGPSGANPTITITDSIGGMTPNLFVGRHFVLRPGGYGDDRGVISSNTATTVSFAGSCPYYSCPGRVPNALLMSGSNWAAAVTSPNYGWLRVIVNAQGTPGWTVDSLSGRTVVPATNLGAYGVITGNLASQATMLVPSFSAADAFTSLAAGQQIFFADGAQYYQATLSVRITDPTASWSPGAWTGSVLVGNDGQTMGTITGNAATTVDLNARVGYTGGLVAGHPFAFGRSDSAAPCYQPGLLNLSVTLAGAAPLAVDSFDGLYSSAGFNLPVLSNNATTAQVTVCGYQFSSVLRAQGATAALTSKGFIPVTLVDTSAAYTPGALKGDQLRPLANNYYFGSQTVLDNTATTISFNLPQYSLYYLSSIAPGASYFLNDPKGYVQVRVATNAALTPGSLVGRFVHALTSSYYDQPLGVVANDATSVTANLTPAELSLLANSNPTLQLSAGVVVAVGDTSAAFTPGALTGQVARLAGRDLLISANTAQGLVVATSDTGLAGSLPAAGSTYSIQAVLAGGNRVRVRADGSALVGLGRSQAAIADVNASGVTALYTPLGTGKPLQVAPRAALLGTYTSITGNEPFFQINDSKAPFTAGALAGAAVTVRSYNGWTTSTVISNTTTSLTVYAPNGLAADSSQAYFIDTMRLDVAGGGLTPHAFAGASLWLQGVTYPVRDNDAGSLLLQPASPDSSAAPAPAIVGGAPAWILSGLRGRMVNGVALSGTGFVAATDDGLALFDGTNWSHLGVRETSGTLGTGSVDNFTPTTVTCNACSFTPNALVGGQLWLSDGAHDIQSNTAQVITLSYSRSIAQQRPPLLGDSFVVLDGRGLTSDASDVAVDGSTTWVPFLNGLLKGASANWSLLTSASTESAPGKADGLPPGALKGAAVHAPGELWVSSSGAGVSRLAGSTWTRYTASSTESSPGKGNGLPGDYISRISFDGPRTWFAGSGAASFDGTTWTAVPYSQVGFLNVVTVNNGVAWFGSYAGLFRLAP